MSDRPASRQFLAICSRAGSIEDLCERYGASLATIRRGLQELEDPGLLRRVRGGATPIEPLFHEPFRTNSSFQDLVGPPADEKRRIGQAAATCVGLVFTRPPPAAIDICAMPSPNLLTPLCRCVTLAICARMT
jgi:DNA-binding transcriptional MocR family regulator